MRYDHRDPIRDPGTEAGLLHPHWPFGRHVIEAPGAASCLSVVFNVVWLVLFGWELFVGHIVSGLLVCATIVSIPFGVQAFRLSVLSLWPFGRLVVEG